MTQGCPQGFERRLLSGFLDRELTQQDEQRVRLHAEACASCRRLLQELQTLREVTMGTQFEEPTDEQWREAPRSPGSRVARGMGWTLVVAWLIACVAFAGWEVVTSPARPIEKLLMFCGGLGIGLLFLSVLLDRIRGARSDRYKGVER
jgi:predicted anti-sigma-YlaC factor YlaD